MTTSDPAAAPLRIVIIGAGMGGLSLAAALRKLGLEATVFEQAAELKRVGAGIHVKSNAMMVLLGLGLPEETVRRLASVPPWTVHRDAYTGKVTEKLVLGEAAVERFGGLYTTWHRGDLQDALSSLVPPEVVKLGKKLVEVEETGDAVRVTFADGTTEQADLLVAADGVHSVVREQVFRIDAPYYTGRVAYRAVVPRSAITAPELDPSCKWWGTDRHFVHYSVSAGAQVAFTTSIPERDWPTESWSARGDLGRLRKELAGFHPDVQAILEGVGRSQTMLNRWAIHSRQPLKSWRTDRVVLLGDACHTMTPYVGQGAAMAMEDAVILARCLADSAQNAADQRGALARYEHARRIRASAMQRIAESNSRGRGDSYFDWAYSYNAWEAPLDEAAAPLAS